LAGNKCKFCDTLIPGVWHSENAEVGIMKKKNRLRWENLLAC